MQRDLAAILFYEDGVFQSPYSHTGQDTVGVSLNSDPLFLGNVQAAAATLFTLARPIAPEPIDLRLHRNRGDDLATAQLTWTGGFPTYDVHRLETAPDVRDNANILSGQLTDRLLEDSTATGRLYYYSVEESP